MDDLDWKGKWTNLLSAFWRPLVRELHALNPRIIVIGEQADWGYGNAYFEKGDLDAVFAFPLKFAIAIVVNLGEEAATVHLDFSSTPLDERYVAPRDLVTDTALLPLQPENRERYAVELQGYDVRILAFSETP
jgi:hypothetical protein